MTFLLWVLTDTPTRVFSSWISYFIKWMVDLDPLSKSGDCYEIKVLKW